MYRPRHRTTFIFSILLVLPALGLAAASPDPTSESVSFTCGDSSTRGSAEVESKELIQCAKDLRAELKPGDKFNSTDRKETIQRPSPADEPKIFERTCNKNSTPACLTQGKNCSLEVSVACLNRALATVESALRDRAATLVTAIAADEKLANVPSAVDGNARHANEAKSHKEELRAIQSVIIARPENLFVNFEDYDDYLLQLNTGFEFVNLNKAFDKGLPRIGLFINLNFGGSTINDGVHGFHLGRYGNRLSFAAALTNSAEQTSALPKDDNQKNPPAGKADPGDDTTADGATNEEVKRTFAFGFQSFSPFHRTRPLHLRNDAQFEDTTGLRSIAGFLLEAGGRKADEDTRVASRFYGGLRFASNPEMYLDMLYGKTGEITSHRLEIRGQVPVMRRSNNSRIYLGGIGNFGLDHRDKNEADVIRLYLTWNADLMSFFGGQNNTPSEQ